jgi:hypothetical protein
MDEVDAIAGHRKLIAMLKDVHDVTGSAILLIGEERVDGLLRRFESFYNRVNTAALVHVGNHTPEDVQAVIQQRCEFPVEPDVCREIFDTTGGKSMRTVIDRIREMETYARANGVQRITKTEYRHIFGRNNRTVQKKTSDRIQLVRGAND